eukprot:tig00021468_g21639.t1
MGAAGCAIALRVVVASLTIALFVVSAAATSPADPDSLSPGASLFCAGQYLSSGYAQEQVGTEGAGTTADFRNIYDMAYSTFDGHLYVGGYYGIYRVNSSCGSTLVMGPSTAAAATASYGSHITLPAAGAPAVVFVQKTTSDVLAWKIDATGASATGSLFATIRTGTVGAKPLSAAVVKNAYGFWRLVVSLHTASTPAASYIASFDSSGVEVMEERIESVTGPEDIDSVAKPTLEYLGLGLTNIGDRDYPVLYAGWSATASSNSYNPPGSYVFAHRINSTAVATPPADPVSLSPGASLFCAGQYLSSGVGYNSPVGTEGAGTTADFRNIYDMAYSTFDGHLYVGGYYGIYRVNSSCGSTLVMGPSTIFYVVFVQQTTSDVLAWKIDATGASATGSLFATIRTGTVGAKPLSAAVVKNAYGYWRLVVSLHTASTPAASYIASFDSSGVEVMEERIESVTG